MNCQHENKTLANCEECDGLYGHCDDCGELLVLCHCAFVWGTTEPLKMFFDGNDTIIAYDVEGAIAVWNDTYGDDYESDLYGNPESWKEHPSEKVVSVQYESMEKAIIPPGAKVVNMDGDTDILVSATAEQWISHIGKPHFLCSKEW